MGDNRLSARFGADTTDFKNGITAINRELKLVETGFKATASTLDDWSNNATGLEAKIKSLNQSIDLQKEKVDALHYKFDDMAKVHGENSVEAQKAGIEFNQESTKLNNLQKELGQTGNSLNALKDKSGGLRGALKDMGTQFEKLKQQVPAVGTAISLLTNPISLAVAGIGALAAESKKSITELVTYNKTVREMMQVTGLSADETSRIIQVADDWGIEIGTVRSALELMNKKGITPSIDNLAKIADEYVNATDKSAFMEEATKKYGKSFGDLVPILAKGGDALREQTASIADNMIATDDSIAMTRDWEVALDNTTDTIKGLEYELANGLLPVLVDALNFINDLIGAQLKEQSAGNRLKKAVDAGTISRKEYNKAMWSLRIGTDDYKDTLQELSYREAIEIQRTKEANAESDKLDHTRGTLTTTTEGLTEATNTNVDSITAFTREAQAASQTEVAKTLEAQAKAADAASLAIETATRRMGELNDYINGTLGPNEKKFTTTQGELNTKMGEIQGEIDQAIKDGYDPLGEKVLELKGKYAELKGQYDENATAHEEDTKRIILGILAQEMAAMGFSDTTAFAKIAQKWGLIDQATVDAMTATDKAINWLRNHPGDYAGFEAMMNGAKDDVDGVKTSADNAALALDKITGQHEVGINVTVTGDAIPGILETSHYDVRLTPIASATGFEGLVRKPTLFLAGEAGDEYVNVTPLGARFGNSLAAMQQFFTSMINGLSSQANPTASRGGNAPAQPLARAPISITIQGAPEKEMDMRRLARYVATEIQRRQL